MSHEPEAAFPPVSWEPDPTDRLIVKKSFPLEPGERPGDLSVLVGKIQEDSSRLNLKGPKAKATTPLEEKFERQKRALQKMVRAQLAHGSMHGLSDVQVRALEESLEVLGWLPGVER